MNPRLFGAAFLTDASLYLVLASLPYRAIELDASSLELGILPTLYGLAYMFTATFGGRLSDRLDRLVLARAGCVTFVVGAIVLAKASSLAALFLAVPVLGLGLGFFWSPLQAEISDRTPAGGLTRATGVFNLSWSLGKGLGLALGGSLVHWWGASSGLLAGALPIFFTAVLLPRSQRHVDSREGGVPDPRADFGSGSELDDLEPRHLLWLSWMTNALAFGTGSALNVHAPKLLLAEGQGPQQFGWMLGTVFLAQTVTFLFLMKHRPSFRTLFVAQGLAIAALFLFLSLGGLVRIVALVPLGVALSLAYQASIHTSLNRPHGRGGAAGIHETVLGAGSSSIALLGGAAVRVSGSLEAPFVLAMAILALGALVTWSATWRGSPPPGQARKS